MSEKWNAYICQNGHCIMSFESDYAKSQKHCQGCGALVINSCPDCHAPIPGGNYHDLNMYKVPRYCHNCGEPYPWTRSALETAAAYIREENSLSEPEQQNLLQVLPDVISETPRSSLAAVRLKKALSVVGKTAAESLRQFVIDFGCDLVRSKLGL